MWNSKNEIHSWWTVDQRPGCAWIEKKGPRNEPPFCTLMGQWNVGTTCITYQPHARGWILEFSHPGDCNSTGPDRQCGDENHNNAGVVRDNMFCVATHHAGNHCLKAQGKPLERYEIVPKFLPRQVCGKGVACDSRLPKMER